MCKCGNAFSLLVLIGRAAWPQNNLHNHLYVIFVLPFKLLHAEIVVYFFGGNSKEETPVPIPNTEVKLFCADGTAREAEWESRTLPKIFLMPGIKYRFRVFFCVSRRCLHSPNVYDSF